MLGAKYSKGPITVYSASARAITAAMRQNGIGRLVVTSSSAAAPWPDPSWSWVERNVAHRILDKLGATLYADMRRMEEIVAASGLDWTVMRPLGLANMEPPTEYTVAIDHISGKQTDRGDLASAILDEIDDQPSQPAHHHQRVAVATTNKTLSLPATIWREGIQPQLAARKGKASVAPASRSSATYAPDPPAHRGQGRQQRRGPADHRPQPRNRRPGPVNELRPAPLVLQQQHLTTNRPPSAGFSVTSSTATGSSPTSQKSPDASLNPSSLGSTLARSPGRAPRQHQRSLAPPPRTRHLHDK